MKKNLMTVAILAMAFIVSLKVSAQDAQVVTLQHGDDMQAFYGADAFKSAMNAAATGDVISLSAGTFTATDITKAVVIQGAGYVYDASKNRYRTIISGDFSIQLADGEEGLFIEGIWSDNMISVKGNISRFTLKRSRLSKLNFSGATSSDCMIYQCRIAYGLYPDNHSVNMSIKNSVIEGIMNSSNDGEISIENSIVTNSLNLYNNNYASLKKGVYKNCILKYYRGCGGNEWYNCVWLSTGSSASNYPNEYHNGYGNWFLGTNDDTTHKALFITGINNYSDTDSFKLTEEAAATYLGTDGTQIGIYGGATPFTDVPSTPQVTKKEIAAETDTEGKLSVKITVEAQQ